MTTRLQPGDTAPAFTLTDDTGGQVSLSDYAGRKVIVYFYPAAMTPGCTKQACALRDGWSSIQKKAHVFGVSIDSVKSHEKFIKKHALPFPLLADEDKKLVEAYGVWVEKSMYGKKYLGIERSHFVIDEEGRIVEAKVKIKPEESVASALAALG